MKLFEILDTIPKDFRESFGSDIRGGSITVPLLGTVKGRVRVRRDAIQTFNGKRVTGVDFDVLGMKLDDQRKLIKPFEIFGTVKWAIERIMEKHQVDVIHYEVQTSRTSLHKLYERFVGNHPKYTIRRVLQRNGYHSYAMVRTGVEVTDEELEMGATK